MLGRFVWCDEVMLVGEWPGAAIMFAWSEYSLFW